CGCVGDADGSGFVNGVDLAAVLNVWGTNGGKYPGADINRDGTVNATDLAAVLNGWGACP
ncbi:MAG: dockerin type I domain-containing protein, partial [Phycisphaerales bacterium]